MRQKIFMVQMFVASVALALSACASVESPKNQSQPEIDRSPSHNLTTPPWGQTVSKEQIAPVYLNEWKKAENRRSCALLALPKDSAAQVSGAGVRRAQFSGGWAVAYDTTSLKSAYGVAGTGTSVGNTTEYAWPKQKAWADGSRMGYGLEGGVGPAYLAYVRVAGQSCLYNVWSRVSEKHLLQIVSDLRRVQ